VPEKEGKTVKPCLTHPRKRGGGSFKHGFSVFLTTATTLACAIFTLGIGVGAAMAGDGATEALELRYQAELAIAQAQASGQRELAQAMQESLPDLLQEYLVTRDGTIALDTVDAAYVQEQFKVARAMEEPGVALALDVFAGPGTGYEHALQTKIADLSTFHEKMAGRLSETSLDTHERVMERRLEKIEQHLAKADAVADRFDAKLEAKLEAAAERLAEKVERKAEKAAERAEKVAEKAEEKAEKIAEKAEEKAEKKAEKAEEKAAKIAEKVEEIADKKAKK